MRPYIDVLDIITIFILIYTILLYMIINRIKIIENFAIEHLSIFSYLCYTLSIINNMVSINKN